MAVNEHTLELLAMSRAQPFTYEHETRTFSFGYQVLTAAEIQPYGAPHASGADMKPSDARELLETAAFAYNHVHPLGLPLASRFFADGWTHEIGSEVRDVMADVFFENTDRYRPSEYERLKELRRFDGIHRSSPGELILSTLGNCACLGPDYTLSGAFRASGIKEYTYHNIDAIEQKISLMAGLGHAARRANEWLGRQ